MKDKTVWEVFEQERADLMAYRGAFDGLHSVQTKASPTLLARFDNNNSSVEARARTSGRCVRLCRAGCHPRGRRDGRGNPRRFDRGKVSYNAWHYVLVLQRKPGAAEERGAVQGLSVAQGDESGARAAVTAPRRGPAEGDGARGGARGRARRRHVQRRCGAQRAGPASGPTPEGAAVHRDFGESSASSSAAGRLSALRPPQGARPWSAMRCWR